MITFNFIKVNATSLVLAENNMQFSTRSSWPARLILIAMAMPMSMAAWAQSAPGDDPDGDGINNLTDLDDDNDGILDSIEGYSETCEVRASADSAVASIPQEFGAGRGLELTNDGLLSTFGGAPVGENPAAVLGDVSYGFGSPLPILRAIRFYSNGGSQLDDGQIRLISTMTVLGDADNVLFQTNDVAIAQASTAPGYTRIPFDDAALLSVVTVRFTDLLANGADAIWRDVHYEVCTPNYTDTDGDGVGDAIDLDSDNDGIADLLEATVSASSIADLAATHPNGRYGGAVNADGVPVAANNGSGLGRGTSIILDADGDGIPDAIEVQPTTGYVSVDEANVDVAGVTSSGAGLHVPQDTDADATPDFLDPDSDDDGLVDAAEIDTAITPVFASTDGGIDPLTLRNTQNPTSAEVDYRETPVDVSVVKTGPAGPLLSGQLAEFVLTISNDSADVTNVVLTDTASTGLDCTQPNSSASCSASGGATCPGGQATGEVAVADLLSAGVTLPSVPKGSQVVVTLQCTVTATGQP